MTKQQRLALRKMMEQMQYPSVPGGSWDERQGYVNAPVLVPGRVNVDLLSDEAYKAGWRRAVEEMQEMLFFLLTASRADIKRYLGNYGRPPR